MRSIIVFAIVLRCCIELHALPLPAGQVIKYRVSSKYFSRNNATTSNEHSRDSLYSLLTQIHYGDAAQQPQMTTIEPATTTNEYPEVSALIAWPNFRSENEES
jgi:hypothetical protein